MLQITLKTGAILKNHGVDVLYTREKDLASTEKLLLEERTKIANNAKADLFVSIHANAASDSSANGQETYCYKTGTKAASLAHSIQREMTAVSGLKNRGVKTANYYVLVNYSYDSSTKEETITYDGSTFATRTNVKGTDQWTITTVCESMGVNTTKVWTKTDSGWTAS